MKPKIGDRVRHPARPEWGIGEVLDSNSKVRVFFAKAGEKVLKNAPLELVTGPEASDPALDDRIGTDAIAAAVGRARLSTGQTPQFAFRDPILSVLVRRGGEGPRLPILEEVEDLLGAALSAYDKSGPVGGVRGDVLRVEHSGPPAERSWSSRDSPLRPTPMPTSWHHLGVTESNPVITVLGFRIPR